MTGAARMGKVVSAHVEEIEKFQLKLYAKERRAMWIDPLATVNRFSLSLTHTIRSLTYTGQSADRSGISMSRFKRGHFYNGIFHEMCKNIAILLS